MKNMCILIMSCDKYHDVWEPCVSFLRKFLDLRDYCIYLSTESLEDNSVHGVDRYILTGAGEWSMRLRLSLAKIEEEFVFLLLDDFWLTDRLDKRLLERDIKYLCSNNDVGVIYINYVKWRFLKDYSADYKLWENGMIYRINTRPAIWKKEYLMKIIDERESVWQFERIGSIRSNEFDEKVLCSKKQYISFLWAVTAGKYERKAVKYAIKSGFVLDGDYRKTQSVFTEIKFIIRSKLFMINPELVTRIVGRFRG